MADNSIQVDLELTTKAFEAAIATATKSFEAFGNSFEKANKDLQESFKKVGDAGEDAGDKIAKGGEHASGSWEVFKGVLEAHAVEAAFELIKEAAEKLFDVFIVEGVESALKVEVGLTRLKAALLISGDTANGTLEDFQHFAEELEHTTTVNADAVIGQLALAKQYGLTNEQAKKVVEVATDMAARGYDADTSVKQLSESFSGQAGRLKKLNKEIRGLSEEQLKAGAAAEILGNQFAGSAAGKVDTFGGALNRSKTAFEHVQEAIGNLIIKNPDLIGALQHSVELFATATEYINQNAASIGALISNGYNLLATSINAVIDAGAQVVIFYQEHEALITSLVAGLATAVTAFGIYAVAINAGAIATAAVTAATEAFNFVLAASPMGLALIAATALAAGIYYLATNWDEVTLKAQGFADTILVAVLPAVQTMLEGLSAVAGFFDKDLKASLDAAAADVEAVEQQAIASQQATQATHEAEQKAHLDRVQATQDAADGLKLGTQHTTDDAAAAERTTANAKELAAKNTQIAGLNKAETEAAKQKAKDDANFTEFQHKEAEKRAKEHLALEERISKADREREQSDAAFKKQVDAQRLAATRTILGDISTLQQSSSKELFAVGKAAAIAQATMNTYQGASLALATYPGPIGVAAAALVVTAGLLNVSKILAQQPPPASAGSFANGGIVPGTSFSGDRLTANVNSGEAILNRGQQKRLLALASGSEQGNGGELSKRVDALTAAIASQPILLQLDGEVVAKAVRNQVRGGFDLGVA